MVMLKHLKGLYKNASAFLILSGPSFAGVDHAALASAGVLTMAVNNAPKTFRPNIWCALDPTHRFIRSIFKDPTIMKFSLRSLGNAPNTVQAKYVLAPDLRNFLDGDEICWGVPKDAVGRRSVMLASIKILYLLGVRRIYLLGADFNMVQGEDNYHFEQETTPKKVESCNAGFRWMDEQFTALEDHFAEHGLSILNCTESSGLAAFPHIPIDEALREATRDIPDIGKESTAGMYTASPPEKTPKPRLIRWRNCKYEPDLKPVAVDRLVSIIGLSRSGTHMMADWIGSQIEGRLRYVSAINICGHRTSNTEIFETVGRKQQKLRTSNTTGCYGKTTYLTTLEAVNPATHRGVEWVEAKSDISILLLRNPYNWHASYVESGLRSLPRTECAILWKAYANEFLHGKNIIPVYYDRFVDDQQYRNTLADALDLDIRTDAALDRVQLAGAGSSFDGIQYDGIATRMDVKNRWKHYADTDWMQRLRADEEIKRLLEQVEAAGN
jgi:hypothetical protein